MKSFELAPNVAQNQYLEPAVRRTRSAIEAVLGDGHPAASAVWEIQARDTPRELVLRLTDGEQQSEESFRPSELGGNGAFTERLAAMRDALVRNGAWRVGVRKLMDDVREWSKLLPATAVTEGRVTLNEARSGRYDLPRLKVEVGELWIDIVPIAGWALTPIGAPDVTGIGGLVDIEGSGGPMHLYFLSNNQWVHQVSYTDPAADPNLYAVLDRDGFVRLARECIDV